MVETNVTCMGVVEHRVKFIDPMGYEMIEEIIEGYAKIILESERDKECPRWGTYEEKLSEFQGKIYSKEIKKKVDKKIDEMFTESGMSRDEFREAMDTTKEMRASK